MKPILLVTGGSGYLGSHVAKQARERWRVVATYFAHARSVPGCEMVPLDIRDSAAVARLLEDLRPDAIIHTAYDLSEPDKMQSVIVDGTRHVATTFAPTSARLIHMSTDVVFDGEHAPYGEGDPLHPINSYGQAKAAAEQIVQTLCPDAAIVRTSLVYGFDPIDPRTKWIVDSVRHRKPITLYTDQVRCPIWVEQLAASVLELASGNQPGVWHLAGPQPQSRYEFGERLLHAFGLDIGDVAAGLSSESGQIAPRDCTLDVSKALGQLNSPLWSVDEVLAHLGPQKVT